MLQHTETTAPAPGLLACVAETRIGPSAVFGETRTEPLAFLTPTSHRASADSWPEIASDLGLYSQPDPIGLQGGMNLFGYADGQPLRLIDPLGLQSCCGQGEGTATGGRLARWALGMQPDFVDNDSFVTDALRRSVAWSQVVDDYRRGNCAKGKAFCSNIPLYEAPVTFTSFTAAAVGNFCAAFYRTPSGKILVRAWNDWGLASLTRYDTSAAARAAGVGTLIPDIPAGPGHTVRGKYRWLEDSDPCCPQ